MKIQKTHISPSSGTWCVMVSYLYSLDLISLTLLLR